MDTSTSLSTTSRAAAGTSLPMGQDTKLAIGGGPANNVRAPADGSQAKLWVAVGIAIAVVATAWLEQIPVEFTHDLRA